jgi:4'-phosphopantetheinyl transferase
MKSKVITKERIRPDFSGKFDTSDHNFKKNLKGVPFKYSIKDIFPGAIGLELPNTTIPAILPPLRPWSKNPANHGAWDEIPAYWETYDVITFLADLGMYDPSFSPILDKKEQDQEQAFKTEYFKKRFAVSRSIMKHLLKPLVGAKTSSDVLLGKEKKGRIRVHGRPDICISLSYSGCCIALTVGKQKIGSDIEVVRPLDIRKARSCPLFDNTGCSNEHERTLHFLQVWTMMEAYAKLHDRNPFPLLTGGSIPDDAHFVSYSIGGHFLMSLAFGADTVKDTLLWIDPPRRQPCSSAEHIAGCSSAISNGDTHVRA